MFSILIKQSTEARICSFSLAGYCLRRCTAESIRLARRQQPIPPGLYSFVFISICGRNDGSLPQTQMSCATRPDSVGGYWRTWYNIARQQSHAPKKMMERTDVGILQKNYVDKLDSWCKKEGTFSLLALRVLRYDLTNKEIDRGLNVLGCDS